MGNQSFKRAVEEDDRKAADPAQQPQSRLAPRLCYTGRFHQAPKRLEDDYDMCPTVLGRGASGKVFLATGRQTGDKFAVKSLRFQGVPEKVRQDIKREAQVFLAMDHPRIARLMDVYETDSELRLVMECMEGGELFDRVVDRGVFSEKDAAEALWQMLLALNYIHSHGVVHRDVKLENFMYQRKDTDNLKLIDFGFAKVWEPSTKLAASCGTLSYVAPEVLGKCYTSQCDMWSLGVVLFILLAGYMPFDGPDSQQITMIKSGMYDMSEEQWTKVSDSAKELVKKLMVVDPQKRLTAEQALAHPWIEERHKDGSTPHVDKTVVEALCKFAQASKFRRACMSMMAWSLTYEERLSVRDAFLELDQTHQGTIKLWELKNVLEAKFHMKDEEVARVFQVLNTSHDDEIHYSEFLAAMASSRIQLHDGLLRATFKRFDVDDSGCITRENLQEVLGETFEGAEMAELMRDVHDGCDGPISYEEFIEYLRGGAARDSHVQAASRVIDAQLQRGASKQALARGLESVGPEPSKRPRRSESAATQDPYEDLPQDLLRGESVEAAT